MAGLLRALPQVWFMAILVLLAWVKYHKLDNPSQLIDFTLIFD